MAISLEKNLPPEVTGDDVRLIREALGLSQAGLARLMRMGSGAARTIRVWESGEQRVPGPAQLALDLIRHGARLPASNLPDPEAVKAAISMDATTRKIRDLAQQILDATASSDKA